MNNQYRRNTLDLSGHPAGNSSSFSGNPTKLAAQQLFDHQLQNNRQLQLQNKTQVQSISQLPGNNQAQNNFKLQGNPQVQYNSQLLSNPQVQSNIQLLGNPQVNSTNQMLDNAQIQLKQQVDLNPVYNAKKQPSDKMQSEPQMFKNHQNIQKLLRNRNTNKTLPSSTSAEQQIKKQKVASQQKG